MNNYDYRLIENAIVAASALAAETLRRNFSNASAIKRNLKESRHGLPDYATQADIESEETIRKSLHRSFPEIAFVGEESGEDMSEKDRFFLVDPLDGTSNFTSLRAQFAVCVAYIEYGEVCSAAIASPADKAILHASLGKGAFLTDTTINEKFAACGFHQTDDLREIQLDCEFPLTKPDEFSMVQKLLPSMSGFRKSGSTALDIFYQATGRKSAVISSCLGPYDIAPALLLVRESGGFITDLSGNPASIRSESILSANPEIHRKILHTLQV